MFYKSYLLPVLTGILKINRKMKGKMKTKDNYFYGKWRPGWQYGDGVRGGQNILLYIILGPFREIWEYIREILGNSQGKMFQSVGAILASPLVQFHGAVTVWSVLQLVSHIYSIKPTCCQNNPAKSLLWTHLHQFQYLLFWKWLVLQRNRHTNRCYMYTN